MISKILDGIFEKNVAYSFFVINENMMVGIADESA